ncbi:MAG TPA: membrane dipeptidase [Thermomicrobiales bacterium]|jgi:membrane dipeptidase|nr:membrane dipeptidase [Thermomicrobiales bacterium]
MTEPAIITPYGGPIVASLRYRREFLQERQVLLRFHLPRFRAGHVAGIVIPVDGYDDLALLLTEISESEGQLRLARAPSEARAIMADGAVAVLLGVTFEAIGAKPDILHVYQELGLSVFPLALNPRNLLTDGCGERTGAGLSYLGIDVVRKVATCGGLVDISHTSEAGFEDVAAHLSGPFIASHSNARTLCDNPRNLTDDQARTIAAHGGVVALSTFPTLVSTAPVATLDHFLDQIDYLVQLIGAESVAIGADFIDDVRDLYVPKIQRTDPGGAMYRGATVTTTQGLETIADLRHVAAALPSRGYSAPECERILGGNFLRVWEDARRRAGLPA